MTPLRDAVAMRSADAELLSLALIDARNHTLRWLALFDEVDPHRRPPQPQELAWLAPARWLAGHAGWYQERWIARNLQRARGAAARGASGSGAALASIDPDADAVWDPAALSPADRWHATALDADGAATRSYLAQTLETTGELLAATPHDDAALYWFRAALWHEDTLLERFAALAQLFELGEAAALAPQPPPLQPRAPILFPAQQVVLGDTDAPGFAPDNEQGRLEASVPEFEIDAQPVSWGQFVEFAEDGGYDDARWWDDAGRHWLGAERAPRYVEQLRRGVMASRFGRLERVPAARAACHLSWYEAQAWCRWAGRRLPTEAEWELAALRGASRGFHTGEVREWVAPRAALWPGAAARSQQQSQQQLQQRSQQQPQSQLLPDGLRVQRGSAWLEPPRLAHPRVRWFVEAGRNDGFSGFRSVAL